jgi:solute carrier family 25 protein 42
MPVMERRQTTPQELADPEDCVVNESSEDSSGADEEAAMLALHENPTALPLPEGLPPQTWAQRNLSTLPIEARNVLAGGLAGMVAKSFVAPLDRIKILYQVSSAKFHVWQLPTVVRNIVENEGVAALWKGNFATMIRVFPYSGVQFMVFDRCKLFFLREHEERGQYLSILPPAAQQRRKYGLTPSESLVAGMMAGTVSVLVTYPLDLTRAQLAVLRRHRDGSPTRSFVGVLGDNYRHRGLVGLFRGITPTLLGILPYSGVAFTLNEQGKREVCRLLFVRFVRV